MDLFSNEYDLAMLGDSDSDRYVFNEIYGKPDAYQRQKLLHFIRGGEVVEIGGHKGYFSLLAGKVAKRVVVFEPEQHNFNFLLKNIDLNGFNHITPVRKAVSGNGGVKVLNVSNITAARHSFYKTRLFGDGSETSVITVNLDDIVFDYSIRNISALKLDCEGAEYEVLMKSNPNILKYCKRIVCELHEDDRIPYKMQDLIEYMWAQGFQSDIYGRRTIGGTNVAMVWFHNSMNI